MCTCLHMDNLKIGYSLGLKKGDNMEHRLFDAARTGDITTLELLLQEDPLLLARRSLSSSENPLHVSAFTGQAEFTKEILRRKQGLAMELNHLGFSPLHIASSLGEVDVVRALLRVGKGDLCLVKSKDGLLPLHCAAQRGRSDVIKELVSSCSDALKELSTTSGDTPLHVAVKNNHPEATKVLLEEVNKHNMAPDIVNWENQEGNTVLHLATLSKNLEIVEMLIGERPITSGVNPNISNRRGFTPKDILDLVLEAEGGSVPEMYKLVKIFQKAEAINGKDVRSVKPHRLHQLTSSRCPINLWKTLDWKIQDIKDHERGALLVVSVLIATVTYQAIISPPGSFKTEDDDDDKPGRLKLGRAIMAQQKETFTSYVVLNAIGFLASMAMISLLTRRLPLRNWMRLCIISMMTTYILAIVYISPSESPFTVVALILCALVVVREIILFTKSLSDMIKEVKSRSHS